ncbi:murein biosynthesis integral membrane protein MurJ [Arenivirga flava]|uniref:Membrane protein n=1 Tax=Arenivirga flava TaxID=1930060 RepID=A0AA37UKN3_9MICO|nr:murein biosynthesis integral membrane protein MurJ [Arenivirga flava]GMA29021.1 membrane protein [Arenivirga flava]
MIVAEGGVGRASLLLASGTLVSRLLGFAKAIVLALAIGQVASSAGNAFAIANQLPNNIYALIAGGVLSAVLVPQIVRASRETDGGSAFINRILTLGIVVFIVAAVIATVAAPIIVSLYVREDKIAEETLALAIVFAYWCLPQVLFYAIYSLLGEVLNARRVYGPFTWAPVVNNVVAMAGLVVFMLVYGTAAEFRDTAAWDGGAIALLAGTTTAGVAAQAAFLALFWRRAGLGFRPDFRWRGVGLGRAGKAAGWMFAMVVTSQVAAVLQTNTASIAADEAASSLALQNSWLVFMLPHSIVAVSLITVYYTRMSGHVHAGDDRALRDDVSQSLRTILLVIVFAMVGLMVLAYPFARFFEVEPENAADMAHVMLAYLPGLAAFSTLAVLQRVLYAREETRTAFWLQAVQSGIVVTSALVCSLLPVDWIAIGIATGTTIAGVTQAVLAVLVVRRRIGGIDGRRVLARTLVYLAGALLAGAVGLLIVTSMGGYDMDGWAMDALPHAALTMLAGGSAMAAVYGVLLLLGRDPEVRGLVITVRRRLGR